MIKLTRRTCSCLALRPQASGPSFLIERNPTSRNMSNTSAALNLRLLLKRNNERRYTCMHAVSQRNDLDCARGCASRPFGQSSHVPCLEQRGRGVALNLVRFCVRLDCTVHVTRLSANNCNFNVTNKRKSPSKKSYACTAVMSTT